MSKFEMKNNEASVIVDEHASEIHSFKDLLNDLEYMWQGDPTYWKGRNPTLFPMVGSTWDKKLHIGGKEYVTGNHGFTRNSDFTCIEHDEQHIIMELKDHEETLQQYPFHFTLHICYTLVGKELQIHYEIINENDVVMPFNFGLHPAFRCPIEDGETFEEYHLSLNEEENVNGKNTTSIALNRDALQETIIITDPKSTETTLTNGRHNVTVHYEGYEWLAFWSPKAPFVCIEPWHGHTDFTEVDVPFEKREGTILLDAHQKWTSDYQIRIH